MIGESAPSIAVDDADQPSDERPDDDGSSTAPEHRRVRARRTFRPTLAVWFLIIAIPMGTFLAFAIPAFQGLDEPNHFLRVWTITDGALVVPQTRADQRSVDIGGMRSRVGPGVIRRGLTSHGVVVDSCLATYIADNLNNAALARPMDPGLSFRAPAGCRGQPNVFEKIDNTSVNSPVAYAPQVLAVVLLRAVGAPLPLIFYGGRLFGLAVFLALVALAIRLAPRGKALLFVLALLPMSLQSAATYNADALLLAGVLLTVALTMRCASEDGASWGAFAGLVASVWFVALCKEPYGVLALLVLLVPAARLAGVPLRGHRLTTRAVTLVKVAVVAVAAVLSAAWLEAGVRGSSLAAIYPPHDINQHVQGYTLVHHPVTALTTILHTLENTTAQQFTFLSAFLELGFFRNQPGGSIAPVLVGVVGVLALFAAYTCELAGGRFAGRWSSGPAVLRTAWLWLPTLLVAVIVGLLYVETFVRDTPAGSNILAPLDGIPGRYFLPLVALPMVSVAMAKGTGTRRVPKGWLIAAMVALSIYLVIKVFTRFW